MNIVLIKLFIRGFLVILTHLRAIEAHLGMHKAVEAIDPEIVTFSEYLYND